jgi:hypothetical protein
VPTFILCEGDGFGMISRIDFRYQGGETGDKVDSIDFNINPFVYVRTAYFSGTILELKFGHSVGVSGLREVAQRLEKSAASIALILDKWADKIVS